MTEYAPTPFLGLKRPQVNTGQQWKTQDYIVDNFNAIEAFAVATDGRADQIEKFTIPGAVGTTPAGYLGGLTPRGTSAERNTYYGNPGTAAERVALANKGARWFNTELGYEEQYFSNDGDAGANLKLSAFTEGWYPTGSRMKPYVLVDKDIAQNTINGMVTVTWSTSEADYDAYDMYTTAQNTRLTAPISGLYRCSYSVRSNGTVPLTANVAKNGTIYGRGISSDSGALGAASSCLKSFPIFMSAGDYIEVQLTATGASAIVSVGGNNYFELEYIGPAPK